MSKLRESHLLMTAFKFVILPLAALAAFGCFFPFMYSIVPAHEIDTCICLFFREEKSYSGNRRFPIIYHMDSKSAYDTLIAINSFSFYSLNWVFILINVIAIYRIRKMRDRLDIRLEMTLAVAIWSVFDFLQYIVYFFSQMQSCALESPVLKGIIEYSGLASYMIIISRDFVTHCVMVYFVIRVNRRESNIKAELAKTDSKHDLAELKTVLNSCRPLMCFSNFLNENKPDHLALLDFI